MVSLLSSGRDQVVHTRYGRQAILLKSKGSESFDLVINPDDAGADQMTLTPLLSNSMNEALYLCQDSYKHITVP